MKIQSHDLTIEYDIEDSVVDIISAHNQSGELVSLSEDLQQDIIRDIMSCQTDAAYDRYMLYQDMQELKHF